MRSNTPPSRSADFAANPLSIRRRHPSLWIALGLPICLSILFFTLSLMGPSNLLDNDQERPTAYALDALVNGNWLIMVDQSGDIMSKPPFSTWITALLALPFSEFTLFNLYLPSLLALLAQIIMIVLVGGKHFGRMAAFAAAVALVLSPVGFKQMVLARTDPTFAAFTFACALAGYHAWSRNASWWPFWILAIISTLTKGPLGLILALGGLGAAFWDRKSPPPRTSLNARAWWSPRNHLLPFILLIAVCGLWFLLAWMQLGDPVIEKMLYKELAGHAVKPEEGGFIGQTFYIPFFFFLTRFLPWSLFAYWGLYRMLRHPSTDPDERRFERFLFCYFMFGMTIFGLVPHQRADLLWPLLPAGALFAGREIERMCGAYRRRLPLIFFQIGLGVLLLMPVYLFAVRANELGAIETSQARELAERIDFALDYRTRELIEQGRIKFYDCPYGVQFFFGVMEHTIEVEEAARLLKEGKTLIITGDVNDIYDFIPPESRPYEVITVPYASSPNNMNLVSPTADPRAIFQSVP